MTSSFNVITYSLNRFLVYYLNEGQSFCSSSAGIMRYSQLSPSFINMDFSSALAVLSRHPRFFFLQFYWFGFCWDHIMDTLGYCDDTPPPRRRYKLELFYFAEWQGHTFGIFNCFDDILLCCTRNTSFLMKWYKHLSIKPLFSINRAFFERRGDLL